MTVSTTTQLAPYRTEAERWYQDRRAQLFERLPVGDLIDLVDGYIFSESLTLAKVARIYKEVPEDLLADACLGSRYELEGDFVERFLSLPKIERCFTLAGFNAWGPQSLPSLANLTSPIMRLDIEGLGFAVAFRATVFTVVDDLWMTHVVLPAIIDPLLRVGRGGVPLFQFCSCTEHFLANRRVDRMHAYRARPRDAYAVSRALWDSVEWFVPDRTIFLFAPSEETASAAKAEPHSMEYGVEQSGEEYIQYVDVTPQTPPPFHWSEPLRAPRENSGSGSS